MIYGLVVLFVTAFSGQAISDSVLGDLMDDLCDGCGLGEVWEHAQREMVQAVLTYEKMEEVILQGVERLTRDGFVESAAPHLCTVIRRSRDSARRAGTRPVPKDMHDRLRLYFGSGFLDGVEYRVGDDGDLSLQAIFLPLGTGAITLDHVIVFRSRAHAESLWLWSHELEHVRQVERSGLDGFCADYLRNFLELEQEADRVADVVAAQLRLVGAGP